MSFNKFLPNAAPTEAENARSQVLRARVLRHAWLVSMLMLVTGYILAALAIAGRL